MTTKNFFFEGTQFRRPEYEERQKNIRNGGNIAFVANRERLPVLKKIIQQKKKTRTKIVAQKNSRPQPHTLTPLPCHFLFGQKVRKYAEYYLELLSLPHHPHEIILNSIRVFPFFTTKERDLNLLIQRRLLDPKKIGGKALLNVWSVKNV